jgi:hypothetical protein
VNLEQLRKQAKELVRAARAGEADALARLGAREPILARARLVLAREDGYPSWPALVMAVEANAEAFVLAATDQRRVRAEAMLAARDRKRSQGAPRAWPHLGRRCEPAGGPTRLGAAPVRLPLVLPERRARP